MLHQIDYTYKEYPDIDVVDLKDGTFIGITEELICYYPTELFSEEYICIKRPDPRNRYDQGDLYFEINDNYPIMAHGMIANTDSIVLKDGTELLIQATIITLITKDKALTLKRNFNSPYYHILCLIQDVRTQGEQRV